MSKSKKFTGVKLSFEDGECVKINRGIEILPHRVDVIQDRLDRKELSGLDKLFFNFAVPDCRNASTRDQLKKEQQLFVKFLKLIQPSGFTPDAA